MAKVGDDLFYEHQGISGNTHCGGCGYNLRTRPLIGRCPECGNEYNARPQHQSGIFHSRDTRFPLGPLLLGFLGLVLGGPLLYFAVVENVDLAYVPAIAFLFFALGFFGSFAFKFGTYWRERALIRNVERSAEEGDA